MTLNCQSQKIVDESAIKDWIVSCPTVLQESQDLTRLVLICEKKILKILRNPLFFHHPNFLQQIFFSTIILRKVVKYKIFFRQISKIFLDQDCRQTFIKLKIEQKYQPSGAGGTRSPPATPHRLQHLTAH